MESSEYERGRAAQEADEFRRHFLDLNGSVQKTGERLEALTAEVRSLREGELERRKADQSLTRREKVGLWIFAVVLVALAIVTRL